MAGWPRRRVPRVVPLGLPVPLDDPSRVTPDVNSTQVPRQAMTRGQVGVFGLVDEDRNHEGAELLAGGLADHSADCVNDVQREKRLIDDRVRDNH